ncbi:hypothetical protein NUW58_g7140 [Xylaria curta]|uniref:Uncharacterized protein n=1 Tax=Xylaria curta TaxID=42375 RepID=A0ACC1NK40_9PEZI|nr:hypothetical protein NUW58_g7140 [Xylaria curta]
MSDVKDLRISVIGAGMGGLACALAFAKKGFKKIDVYESASNLGFVGAGIQLAPNLARVLDRWGCWAKIHADATTVTSSSIREGTTNRELALVKMHDVVDLYGYSHCVGHRASLAGSMFEACQKESAITFHFSTALETLNNFGPDKVSFTVKPRDGEAYDVETDILLGADGIKSIVRTTLLKSINSSAEVEDTGQAAYRIMLSRSQMEHDPEMLELLDSNCALRWIGEKRHIVAYPISNKTIYNLSTCQPDTNFAVAPSMTYTTRGDKSVMMKVGATMAIEDAAVVAECVSAVPVTDGKIDREALSRSLQVYELLRKDRTAILVDMAEYSGRILHLGEGQAKEERDRQFAEGHKKGNGIPDKWASPEVQQMIYSHDCVASAQENFAEIFSSLTREKTNGVAK